MFKSKLRVAVSDSTSNRLNNVSVRLYRSREQVYELTYNTYSGYYEVHLAELTIGQYTLEVKSNLAERPLTTQPIYIPSLRSTVTEQISLLANESSYYYLNNTRIPFQFDEDLFGVTISPTTELTTQNITALQAYATERNLIPVQSENSELLHQQGLYIFRYPTGSSQKGRDKINQELSNTSFVNQVGIFTAPIEANPTLLTNELIVRFQNNVSRAEAERFARWNDFKIRYPVPYAGNAYLLVANSPISLATLKKMNNVAESEEVIYAEPNEIISIVEDAAITDPLSNQQFHHDIIQTGLGWDTSKGNSDIVIAVVDSGFDIQHEDLCASNGGGSCSNIINPANFSNLFNFTNVYNPSNPHGTLAAGIAVAQSNNLGGAGIAPNCTLMPVRYPGYRPRIEYANMYIWIAGFNAGNPALPTPPTKPADVISNSYGFYSDTLSGIMKDAFDYITTYGRGGKGCVVVFSAGNKSCNLSYCCDVSRNRGRQWAAYEKTIAVAASTTDTANEKRLVKVGMLDNAGSNYGMEIDVCAPAGQNNSAPKSTSSSSIAKYESFGETSCACPQVAALAAIILSVQPNLTWVEVRQIIRDTAKKIDLDNNDFISGATSICDTLFDGRWVDSNQVLTTSATDPFFSKFYGYGRINVADAIKTAKNYPFKRNIVIRDNIADDGLLPSSGIDRSSVDIWVRNIEPSSDNFIFPNYNETPDLIHQHPRRGQSNWIYVRFKNIGDHPSYPFYIRIYLAHYPAMQFAYPNDFIPDVSPSATISAPLDVGTYLLAEVRIDQLTDNTSDYVAVEWKSNLIPPTSVTTNGMILNWQPNILAEISPHDGFTPPDKFIRHNNNLAAREINIIDTAVNAQSFIKNTTDEFVRLVMISHAENKAKTLAIEIEQPALLPDLQLFIKFLDTKPQQQLEKWIAQQKNSNSFFNFFKWLQKIFGLRPKEIVNFRKGKYKNQEVIWLANKKKLRFVIPNSGRSSMVIGVISPQFNSKNPYSISISQYDNGKVLSGSSTFRFS